MAAYSVPPTTLEWRCRCPSLGSGDRAWRQDIPEEDPGIEPDRLAWNELAGHSHYLREIRVKRTLSELKRLLRSTQSS